jgi:hypothetical protein
MKTSIVLFLIPITFILISGCTDMSNLSYNFGPLQWNINPFGGSGNGVSIISFTSDMRNNLLSPNEDVVFEVKMKNTGSVKSTGGFAELLGLDQSWSTGEEIWPNQEDCRYDTRKIALLPRDDNTGAAGGEYVCTWNYRAPSVPMGEISYEPTVRVFYTYTTSAVSAVTLVPKEELNNYIENGGSLKSNIISSTKSPIEITMKTRGAVKVGSGGKTVFPIEITIKNVGGGTVCLDAYACKKSNPGGQKWDELMISMDLPEGLNNYDCPLSETVRLSMGKEQIIKCNLEISNPANIGSVTQKYITINSQYGYFTDSKMSIKVKADV